MDVRVVDEEVHGGRHVRVERTLLQLPGLGAAPPLGLEHTVLAGARAARGHVVLVHGLAQNHRTWRLSRRSWPAALAERGWSVYNLDLRGHGLSREFGAPAARRVEDYVVDLVRVVEAVPGRPFVVGHSLGAAVSVRAAPRVQMAGLVHLAGIYTFATQNATLRTLARMTRRLSPVLPGHVHVNTRGIGTVMARYGRAFDRAQQMSPLSAWRSRAFERELASERVLDGFDRSALAIWKEMAGWALGDPVDVGGAFARLDLPLLVLTGEADNLAHPVDGRAAYQASASRDRAYVNFTRAIHGYGPGHLDIILGRRAPEIVWPVMLDWLEARDHHCAAEGSATELPGLDGSSLPGATEGGGGVALSVMRR